MPDVYFKVSLVRKTYRAYAGRQAVLWPLMRHKALYDDLVIQDVKRLVGLWRERLKAIKAAGWPDLGARGKLQFARNCPPELVITEQASQSGPLRPCRLHHFCPWCAIRRVYEVYNKLAQLLPAKGKTTNATFQLVELRHSVPFQRSESQRHLDALFAYRNRLVKKTLHRLQPLGAYWTMQLNPRAVDRSKSYWKSVVRILAVLPKDWVAPDWLSSNSRATVRVTKVASLRDLIGPVGRTCRYPVGLMHCDPYTAMMTLNAIRGQRTSGFTGILYGNNARKTTNGQHNLTQADA